MTDATPRTTPVVSVHQTLAEKAHALYNKVVELVNDADLNSSLAIARIHGFAAKIPSVETEMLELKQAIETWYRHASNDALQAEAEVQQNVKKDLIQVAEVIEGPFK